MATAQFTLDFANTSPEYEGFKFIVALAPRPDFVVDTAYEYGGWIHVDKGKFILRVLSRDREHLIALLTHYQVRSDLEASFESEIKPSILNGNQATMSWDLTTETNVVGEAETLSKSSFTITIVNKHVTKSLGPHTE